MVLSAIIDKHSGRRWLRDGLALPPNNSGASMADLLADRAALALEHVTKGRRIVARQRQLIAEIRDRGGDCSMAEELLSAFERSLAVFEDDSALIIKMMDQRANPNKS